MCLLGCARRNQFPKTHDIVPRVARDRGQEGQVDIIALLRSHRTVNPISKKRPLFVLSAYLNLIDPKRRGGAKLH